MIQFDKQFFEKNQKKLLKVANSRLLRWLLGLHRLPKNLKDKKLSKISTSSIHYQTGKNEFKCVSFTRPRFAEALAFNLSPFVYFKPREKFVWRFSPVGAIASVLLLLFPKGLPIAFMGTVTDYPVGSGDGEIDNANANFSTCRSASSGNWVSYTDATGIIQDSYLSPNYYLYRDFFPVDTSAISDTATIESATFDFFTTATAPSGSPVAILVGASQASPTELVVGDYDQVGSTKLSDTEQALTSSQHYSLTLNASGLSAISKTSWTLLALRGKHDFDNDAPTDVNNQYFYFSEQTGTSEDPYLSVTYTIPSTFIPQVIII